MEKVQGVFPQQINNNCIKTYTIKILAHILYVDKVQQDQFKSDENIQVSNSE